MGVRMSVPRVILVTFLAVALPVTPGVGAALPDIAVKGTVAQRYAHAGGEVAVDVSLTVTEPTAVTATRIYLSTDRTLGSADVLLGSSRFPGMKPGQSTREVALGKVPSAQKLRRYYIIACADALRKIRESNEANNCHTESLPTTVTRVLVTTSDRSALFTTRI